MRRRGLLLATLSLLAGCDRSFPSETSEETSAVTSTHRAKFSRDGTYLILEMLDDDLLHFEVSHSGAGSSVEQPIYTTPMVAKRDYAGASSFVRSGAEGNVFDSRELRITVDVRSFCFTVFDKPRGLDLSTFCPFDLSNDWKGLTMTRNGVEHVYGLGEQFTDYGSADGSWIDRLRTPGGPQGNAMVGFGGGAPGNTQIPMMYATGRDTTWGFFLDQVYKQEWSFQGDRFRVSMWGDQIRGYVISGPDLPDIRSDYMELVGRPLVPPKKMFGYWASELGYDDWNEVDGVTDSLRRAGFPLDGVALDILWFGTSFGGEAESRGEGPMGKLTFDPSRFPNAREKIASLKNDRGLGVMLIEESYVNRALDEHRELANRGFLARDCENCGPTFLDSNPWWGKGGMIDWTNAAAGDDWHDLKRRPLVEMGVTAFWTDLGEPEMYNPWAWYAGFPELGKHQHGDVHNIYALDWLASIHRGYTRNNSRARPFIMSRAGAAGIQRFGGAMWSGDIGANQGSLAAQSRVQMHMSMSGVDYFGADTGGFHRSAIDGNIDELFTQWFATGALFDVPLRTHAWNLCNCQRTTPETIGHTASNLANARLRTALVPYLYSLAHRAHLYGEAIYPPLAYWYGSDPNAGELGSVKMIGRDLIAAIVARYGESERDVYLPRGRWIDFHRHESIESSGQWVRGSPEYRSGLFHLPLFARAGAIIPLAFVDGETENVVGKRRDGSRRDDLILRVYADAAPSSFTVYEDDGESTDYLAGFVRTTRVAQVLSGNSATVTIEAASGSYAGAPSARPYKLELVALNARATAVSLNGQLLPRSAWSQGEDDLIAIDAGVHSVSSTLVLRIDLSPAAASASINFVCDRATTRLGESVYVVGDVAALGAWDPARAKKLDPSVYPKWTGVVRGLPPNTTIRWKCIKRWEANATVTAWLPGNDRLVTTGASGPSGTAYAAY